MENSICLKMVKEGVEMMEAVKTTKWYHQLHVHCSKYINLFSGQLDQVHQQLQYHFANVFRPCFSQSKKDVKDQETMQSSTTPDPVKLNSQLSHFQSTCPPVIFFTDCSKAVLLFWTLFVYLCFTFVFIIMWLSCLFLAAWWSPAEKGLASWLSCVWCFLVFVTFLYGVSGQVCYLIVSIPDICRFLVFALPFTFKKFGNETGACDCSFRPGYNAFWV